MDSVTVDVTDVPGPPVTVDDEFVLLGRQGTAEAGIDELARRGATIAYEVVALLGRRLSRVYDSSSGTGTIRTLTGEVRR
jgi:alanine racemase